MLHNYSIGPSIVRRNWECVEEAEGVKNIQGKILIEYGEAEKRPTSVSDMEKRTLQENRS